MRWSSQSKSGPIVIAIDGNTQSLWPEATTIAGAANDAISWTMVAIVTARSIRLPSGPVGRGATPDVARRP